MHRAKQIRSDGWTDSLVWDGWHGCDNPHTMLWRLSLTNGLIWGGGHGADCPRTVTCRFCQANDLVLGSWHGQNYMHSMPYGFRQTDGQFGVVSMTWGACAPFCVGSGKQTVRFWGDAMTGTACTLCRAGSAGPTVHFKVDGTGPMGRFACTSTTRSRG